MKKFFTAIFAVAIAATAFAAELKDTIKLEIAEEIQAGSPIVIKLSNIPKNYRFHGYLFHAAHTCVPAGLAKGADVYVRKNKNPPWVHYIFGSTMADRLTYIKAQDMWKRNFDLSFKTTNWPVGDYQTGVNLSFLDENRKQIMVKKQLVFSIVEKEDSAK